MDGNKFFEKRANREKPDYPLVYIYNVHEHNNTGAEIFTLEGFLLSGRSGYWHDIAVQRLKELGVNAK